MSPFSAHEPEAASGRDGEPEVVPVTEGPLDGTHARLPLASAAGPVASHLLLVQLDRVWHAYRLVDAPDPVSMEYAGIVAEPPRLAGETEQHLPSPRPPG